MSGTEDVTQEALVSAVSDAFRLAYPDKAVATHLDALVTRVLKRIDSFKQHADEGVETLAPAKTLGSALSRWVTSLDNEGICLYLAEFDPVKAYDLYWRCDLDWVVAAVTAKSGYDNRLVLSQWEATMYGFGGKYSDDDGDAQHFNLAKGEGLNALKSLGF